MTPERQAKLDEDGRTHGGQQAERRIDLFFHHGGDHEEQQQNGVPSRR